MKYLLHVDHTTNSAIIHKEGCPSAANAGPYKDGTWEEFDSLEAASAAMSRSGKKTQRGCMRCAP